MKLDRDHSILRARELRKKQTGAESVLWEHLRNRAFHSLKFRRQHPIGFYIVDFCCVEKKLIIELDGDIHHDPDQKVYDTVREEDLVARGFKVIRFSNQSVQKNLEDVFATIEKSLQEPSPGLAATLSQDGRGLRQQSDKVGVRDVLTIAEKEFSSRLMLGTGKFASRELLRGAIDSSATEIVTVALRRVDLAQPADDILSVIDRETIQLLPNTSGARDAKEAIMLAQLAREGGLGDWVKLEVIPDARYLLPDGVETLKAAEQLVKDGFTVLPYMQADPLLAKQLADAGCATVMPLASPIGSNQGLKTRQALEMIIEQATVPVVVDAGLGAPSHACEAMELGADAVLVNTAIATAGDPVVMAAAFAKGVEAGRDGYLAGRASMQKEAAASSPLTGFLHG